MHIQERQTSSPLPFSQAPSQFLLKILHPNFGKFSGT